MRSPHIAPAEVHATLARRMLADGYDMVLDLEKSHGRRLYDSRSGREYLDLFSFFATLPIGFNHAKMKDPDFLAKLTRAALVNPTNSDIYTTEFAEFVEVFGRVAMRPWLPHAFFVAGGALGVENALKAAMDWKVRQNFRKGVKTEKGHQILHFREAFHGRSGYTVSMTNTADARKYEYFAKFDWPRVSNPHLRFPVDSEELARVQKAEAASLAEIRRAFAERKDDIAAILLEPIQAEGGDHHFRPEFLAALKSVAHEHDAAQLEQHGPQRHPLVQERAHVAFGAGCSDSAGEHPHGLVVLVGAVQGLRQQNPQRQGPAFPLSALRGIQLVVRRPFVLLHSLGYGVVLVATTAAYAALAAGPAATAGLAALIVLRQLCAVIRFTAHVGMVAGQVELSCSCVHSPRRRFVAGA